LCFILGEGSRQRGEGARSFSTPVGLFWIWLSINSPDDGELFFNNYRQPFYQSNPVTESNDKKRLDTLSFDMYHDIYQMNGG